MEICKKLPMVVLAAVPYLYLAGVAAVGLNSTAFSVWLVIFLLLEVPNVAYAFLWPRWGGTVEGLLFWNMVIKLCHIPFFLLLTAAVVVLNVYLLPLVPFLFVLAYTLVLSSSAYGFSALRLAVRQGRLDSLQAAGHIFWQCMFCSDVVDAVCCWRRLGRIPKEQP